MQRFEDDIVKVAVESAAFEKIEVECEIADFIEVMGIAAQGDFDAGLEAELKELEGRLIGVEIDFGGRMVFLQQMDHGLIKAFRDGQVCASEDTERVRQAVKAMLEKSGIEREKFVSNFLYLGVLVAE